MPLSITIVKTMGDHRHTNNDHTTPKVQFAITANYPIISLNIL